MTVKPIRQSFMQHSGNQETISSTAKLPISIVGTSASRGPDGEDQRIFAETIDPVFTTRIEESDKASRADLTTYFMGPGMFFLADMAGAQYLFRRDISKIARSGLDLILIQMTLEGGDRRTTDDKTVVTARGDISFADLSRTFQSETTGCRNASLVVPRHLLFRQESQTDRLHGMVLGRQTAAGRLIGGHFQSLRRSLSAITVEEAPVIVHATTDLIATLLSPNSASETGQTSVVRSAAIVEIKRYIDQHLAAPDLGPDHLCKVFALSRASLYRLFEPIGGVTDYIRARRLRRAFDALSGGRERTIGEVAYATGFSDASAFSRAFRNHFGFSPSEIRATPGERGRGGYFAPPEVAAGSVRDWLRMIAAL